MRRVADLIAGIGLGGVTVVLWGEDQTGWVADGPGRASVVVRLGDTSTIVRETVRADRVALRDEFTIEAAITAVGVSAVDAADLAADVADSVVDVVSTRPHLEDDARNDLGGGLIAAWVADVSGPEIAVTEAGWTATESVVLEVQSAC